MLGFIFMPEISVGNEGIQGVGMCGGLADARVDELYS
jgi:hypothetical protein